MVKKREVLRILKSKPTMEGAGVRLKRAFGYHEVPLLDPFLLLDDFHSDNPDDYIAGFPWHPHRGIETVTYMLQGKVRHEDSMGNSGVISSGDIQWMTAGSGIIHSEMPEQQDGLLWGFQLWVNLPASRKMMPPRYQEIKSDEIPIIEFGHGVTARLICGRVKDHRGPVKDIVVDPLYIDFSLSPGGDVTVPVSPGHRAFAYIVEGDGLVLTNGETEVETGQLVIFKDGDVVKLRTSAGPLRCLLVAGKPLNQPVAWQGPIVMNTHGELQQAFDEFRNGTFIKG